MEKPIAPTSQHPKRCLALLLLIVAVTHAPGLFAPFFLDDYVYVEQVHDLTWHNALRLVSSATLDRSASSVWWTPSGALPFYRPVGQLSFAVDYLVWGPRPFGYHLTNTALHMICTLLVWRLALRVFGSSTCALTAAAVFALHPVHVEAVTWISGRFDLLVCVWALACILSYLKWSDGAAREWRWAGLSLFWFALSLGSKETALVVPVMLACVEALYGSGLSRGLGRLGVVAAAFAVVAMLYVAGRVVLFGSLFGKLPPPYGVDISSPLTALQNITRNLAQYLFDMVLLIPVEPVYLSEFWKQHPLLFGIALAAAALLLASLVVAGRSRALGLALVWLVVFTAPSLLSMPGERNVYLASVGLALLITAAFRGLQMHGQREPETGILPPPTGRLRRASYVVVCLWLVICVVKQTLMGALAVSGEKSYRDLQVMLPDPPRDARIYVVHQNPLNSVGFSQALRLRYGRPDLSGCALSLSPSLCASPTDAIVAAGPDSVRLIRPEGSFFTSFFERFYRFSEPASGLADAARHSGLLLLDPPTTFENLRELKFRLPLGLDDPRMQVFCWDNTRVGGRLALLRTGSLTQLKPCKPVCSGATRPKG